VTPPVVENGKNSARQKSKIEMPKHTYLYHIGHLIIKEKPQK
jgi:hypothetical protein